MIAKPLGRLARATYPCLSPCAKAAVAGSGAAVEEAFPLVNAASEQISPAMVINASLKMTTIVQGSLSRARIRQNQSNTSAKNGSFDSRCPAILKEPNGGKVLPSAGLPLSGLRSIPRFYSIIGRPIQSLLSQRTAKSGCLSPCKRAKAS